MAPPFRAVSWQPDGLHASSRRGVGGFAPPETHPRPAPPPPDRLHVPSRAQLCAPGKQPPATPTPPHPTRTISTPPNGGSAFPPATHHPARLPRPTTAGHLPRSIPNPPASARPSNGATFRLTHAQLSLIAPVAPGLPTVVESDDYEDVVRQLIGTQITSPASCVEADLDRNGTIALADYNACITDEGRKVSGSIGDGVGETGLFSPAVRNGVGNCGDIHDDSQINCPRVEPKGEAQECLIAFARQIA